MAHKQGLYIHNKVRITTDGWESIQDRCMIAIKRRAGCYTRSPEMCAAHSVSALQNRK